MNTLAPVKKLETMRSNLESSKDIVPATAVREFIETKIALEKQIKATWKALESYMIDNGIKNLDCLTIAEKKTWKVKGELPPRFYKQVLDTSKLNFMFEHSNTIPKGASYTTSQYLTKTNRKVEA